MPDAYPAIYVFRSMRDADDGLPETEPAARCLGVRPGVGFGTDIPVDSQGYVYPETGGLSVAPTDPIHLPTHRRPPELGGTGKDPVWRLSIQTLDESLRYRPA